MESKISEVMAHLGRARSEKKRLAAIANSAGTRFKAKRLRDIACNCGGVKLDHKSTCPRGRAIRYRQKKGLPLQ